MSAKRVLVVDDEAQILRALRTSLRGAGYGVETAETAETVEGALTALAEHPPDAVVGVRLESAAAMAGSYGVGVRREIVRTRAGSLGEDVVRVAAEHRAELVVVGAPVESRRGFRRAFPREVLLLVREAPCRVMIATGPVAGKRGATAARTTVPPWHDGAARPSSSSACSARTRSSRPPTATSALRSTTRSA